MTVKERLYQTLKSRNYFGSKEKHYLDILEKAKNLEDVVIQVERSCNVDNFYFRYNPNSNRFDRVILSSKDYDQLEKEAHYAKQRYEKCVKSQCLKREIDIDAFLELLKLQFEPISIYLIWP